MNMKYTWKPDLPDIRDQKYLAESVDNLPSKVDLRDTYTKIYNQGQLGSCTANSISMAFDFERVKQKLEPIVPSRLFIYFNERKMEGTINQDSGAQIRDGIKSVATQGVCPESVWPYDVHNFTNQPSEYAYNLATQNLVKQYLRLDNTQINQLKHCLANGYGFVFGFTVYESFESQEVADTGVVPMPNGSEQSLGGHAVFCVGYDDDKQSFIVRNSWGEDWGDSGHFYLPYEYITHADLADDFWTIRLV
jgi:C1A family cysteine protease